MEIGALRQAASADGSTWNVFASTANAFPLTKLNVGVEIGTWQSEGSTTTAVFDNFNLWTPVYTYDANGNMTSDGKICYTYNEANQLSQVKNCVSNVTKAEYTYDFKGNRMVKKTYLYGNLKDTITSWSDNYETKVSGGTTENTTYYWINGQLTAKKHHDGSRYYYHNDHLGSSTVITNASGTLVEETKYDPWGAVLSGGTKSKFLYTGQENDSETNLHYYNARYYDPHIRRFTQPDDIVQDIYNPQSLNRYSYVFNNPLRYTDPTGHISILDYNNALNQYYNRPSATTYNNALNTASNINKQSTGSTRQSIPNSGSNGSGRIPSASSEIQNYSPTPVKVSSPESIKGVATSSLINLVKSTSSPSSNTGAVGICGTGSAGLGVYGAASACAVYSISEKKFGVTGTLGGGGTTGVTLGAGVNIQYSNSRKFSDLLGQDIFAGGSAGEGLEVNGNVSWSRDNINNKTYGVGIGLGGNFSTPAIPGELNGGSTYTWGFSQ